mgnify:CR=1 FL=1|jgi:hypothetical protein|mmetsp:Transcript_28006/g.63384  ORF Transcript_28006/g.63384 Transcript_28006/m.63384 type:complete len:449 (-) Transcript_28006:132-1478(-)
MHAPRASTSAQRLLVNASQQLQAYTDDWIQRGGLPDSAPRIARLGSTFIVRTKDLSKLGVHHTLSKHISDYSCDQLHEPQFAPSVEDGGLIHVGFLDDRPRPNIDVVVQVGTQIMSPQVRFHLLTKFNPSTAELIRARRHLLHLNIVKIWLPPMMRCIHRELAAQSPLSHSSTTTYLLKPFVPWMVPHLPAMLLLDSDIVIVRDVSPLWALLRAHPFRSFADSPRANRSSRISLPIIGLARENSVYYQHRLGLARKGGNGGVQLLDLEGMRKSSTYVKALHGFASGTRALFARRGHDGNFSLPFIDNLGDQTLYTFMRNSRVFAHHGLFTELPCEWNRQLGSWSTETHSVTSGLLTNKAQSAANRCPAGCSILHANHPSFKLQCVLAQMRQAAQRCEYWERFITFAHTNASIECLGNTIARPQWREAFERFWSGCCARGGTGTVVTDT